jgi:membrane-associated phospholipid phosphatase
MKKYFLFLVLHFLHNGICAQNPDLSILKTLNRNEMPLWDKTMRGTSASVYPVMTIAVGGLLINGYAKKDDLMIRNGYKSAVAIGFAALTSTSLKYFVDRARPKLQYPQDIIERDRAGRFSFPSGHTTSAFATATALSLSCRKWYVTAPSFLYAGFVGYSRMRLGMHFPTDVLGGMVIGIGSGLLTWQIDRMINGK